MRHAYVTEGIDAEVVRRQARERLNDPRHQEETLIHFHPYDDNNDLCQHYPQHESITILPEKEKPL